MLHFYIIVFYSFELILIKNTKYFLLIMTFWHLQYKRSMFIVLTLLHPNCSWPSCNSLITFQLINIGINIDFIIKNLCVYTNNYLVFSFDINVNLTEKSHILLCVSGTEDYSKSSRQRANCPVYISLDGSACMSTTSLNFTTLSSGQ